MSRRSSSSSVSDSSESRAPWTQYRTGRRRRRSARSGRGGSREIFGASSVIVRRKTTERGRQAHDPHDLRHVMRLPVFLSMSYLPLCLAQATAILAGDDRGPLRPLRQGGARHGASRGLGQYLARALARAGADLVITARRKEDTDAFAARDPGPGPTRPASPSTCARRRASGRSGRAVGRFREDRRAREQRRLQRAPARARGHLGRLEQGPRHEPPRHVLRGPGHRPAHGPAREGTRHQHRLRDHRLRLRGHRPLLREPRAA